MEVIEMKMKKIAAIAASAVLAAMMSIGMNAAAEVYQIETDENGKPTKEFVINHLWDLWWSGEPDDGTTFPEASYRRHILEHWVESKYEEGRVYMEMHTWEYNFTHYYNDAVLKKSSMKDDDNGVCYIVDNDGNLLYNFEFVDGMWNMVDPDGNIGYSFEPFRILTEEDTTELQTVAQEITDEVQATATNGGQNDNIYTNTGSGDSVIVQYEASQTAVQATDRVAEMAKQENRNSVNWAVVGAVGCAAAAATAGGGYLLLKKKK